MRNTADKKLLIVLFRENVVKYAMTMIALSLNLILSVSEFFYCTITLLFIEAVNRL